MVKNPILIGLWAIAVCLPVLAREPDSLPNIVVIYTDDLGYGDVSSYNPDRGKILTPHVDRLAVQGMRFTDAHSSSGVCSPSRYTFLTGRYHWRTRLQQGIVGLWGAPLVAPDRLTVASMLKQLGQDLAEQHNLFGDEPEHVAELTALLQTQIERGRSTPGPDQSNDVAVKWNRIQ